MNQKNKNFRILTTNRHEIYLTLLAGLGYDVDVLVSFGGRHLPWREHFGTPKPQLRLVEWGAETEQNIRSGAYDAVVLHTIDDLMFFMNIPHARYFFVIHIALYKHTPVLWLKSLVKTFILYLFWRARGCRFVAVSPWKLSTWCLPSNASVIELATTEVIKASSKGGDARVITIGNHFASRPELNYDLLKFVVSKIEVTVCGDNPEISSAVLPKSREELLQILAQHQIYLFTTEYPWNDGYNTSVLEAMKAGLAIVSLKHPTSPVVHGKGGYLANTREELIDYIHGLRGKPELCAEFGAYNQKIIETQFSYDLFLSRWKALLQS